jgi:phage terminase small subunit
MPSRSRAKPTDPLSERSLEFLAHYLGGEPGVRFNATQAALACGWTTRPHSAHELARAELKKPPVAEAIKRFVQKAHSTAAKALEKTALRAYADARDVMAWDADGKVTLIPSRDISPAGAALVAGIKQQVSKTTDPDGTVTVRKRTEVKLHDGDNARRDLLKVHGLLREHFLGSGAVGSGGGVGTINIYLPDNTRAAPLPVTPIATRARPDDPTPPPPTIALPDNGRATNGAGH